MTREQWGRWAMAAGAAAACALGVTVSAQQGRGANAAQPNAPVPPVPPPAARAAAPVDLTGYWVSAITEDWRFRMVTPPKGDYAGVPLNPAGTKAADQWDRDKDIAAGEQCKPFGAAGIMRMPVRLHITWQDDTTLKIEIDNGQQTRLFHFDRSMKAPAQRGWQGFSVAEWETVAQGQGLAPAPPAQGGRGRMGGPALSGSLKVVTKDMRPGYVRRNGVPYSENALLTEFFDRTTEPNGDSWLIVTSQLDDPMYLQVPFVLTDHFKREPDGSKFNPRPCEETAPVTGTGD